MMGDVNARKPLPLCPSALPTTEGSVVFGVVGEAGGGRLVGYLDRVVPVSQEILALATSVNPAEVFRFGALCAGHGCKHFDGTDCRLATRIVSSLPAVAERLPPCPLRSACRWWQQEGKPACLRCPQIVSETFEPSELLRWIADPSAEYPTSCDPDNSRAIWP
jgi:hypothetical protein